MRIRRDPLAATVAAVAVLTGGVTLAQAQERALTPTYADRLAAEKQGRLREEALRMAWESGCGLELAWLGGEELVMPLGVRARTRPRRGFPWTRRSRAPSATRLGTSISSAHGLGLGVLAEGVASVDQLRALRGMGCDAVQRFLAGQPMPAEEFRAMP